MITELGEGNKQSFPDTSSLVKCVGISQSGELMYTQEVEWTTEGIPSIFKSGDHHQPQQRTPLVLAATASLETIGFHQFLLLMKLL